MIHQGGGKGVGFGLGYMYLMEGQYLDAFNSKYDDGLVSVIMPAYNSEKYIKAAIESALSQSFEKLEIIVSDDASIDQTVKIAEQLSGDGRIKIIKNANNGGVAAARNKAIEKSRGRYIAFLDSDDMWKKNKLEIQLAHMKSTDCGLCYSSYGYVDSNGKSYNSKNARIKASADYKSLLKDNFIGMLTVVVDRQKTGEISFSQQRHEDLILWLELTKKGVSMSGIDQSLALYRVSNQSLSGNKAKAALWRWRLYKNSQKLNLLQSLWYMGFYTINSILKRIR